MMMYTTSQDDVCHLIIRNQVIWTLKASTLNNRAVRSTPGRATQAASTLEESPYHSVGALFQSASSSHQLSAGPSDTAIIERRRFQRPMHVIADNHICH